MPPLIALAGFGGGSAEGDLYFNVVILLWGLLWALFLPIITFERPPLWMIVLQPVVLIAGLLALHIRLRTRKCGLVRRSFLYLATYCAIMFATNMAGPARGLFSIAGEALKIARLIHQGKGWGPDLRP